MMTDQFWESLTVYDPRTSRIIPLLYALYCLYDVFGIALVCVFSRCCLAIFPPPFIFISLHDDRSILGIARCL